MGTRILVLGIHTLGLVLAVLAVTWIAPTSFELAPLYVVAGAYWLYSTYKIMSGKDVLACKVEAFLNSRGKTPE